LSERLLLTLCANNDANAGSISVLPLINGIALFSPFGLSSFVRLAIALLVIVCDRNIHWLQKNYGTSAGQVAGTID
jgi:hypothetical protein